MLTTESNYSADEEFDQLSSNATLYIQFGWNEPNNTDICIAKEEECLHKGGRH